MKSRFRTTLGLISFCLTSTNCSVLTPTKVLKWRDVVTPAPILKRQEPTITAPCTFTSTSYPTDGPSAAEYSSMGLSGEQKYCDCGGVIAGINLATSGTASTSYCATGGAVPAGYTQVAADGSGNPPPPVIASYNGETQESQAEEENSKHCIIYMPPLPGDDRRVSANQCEDFCKDVQPDENGIKSIICSGFWPEGSPDPWVDSPDIANTKMMRGDCMCNNAFLNFVVNEVLEALPIIAQIGCNLLMAAFQFIVQLALQATGIGQIVDAAMAMGIEAAKTIAYAYDVDSEALEEFINWASFCGTDRLPGDMGKVFSVLRDVSDALVGFKVPRGLTPEGGGKGKGGYGKCKNKNKRGDDDDNGKCDKDKKGDKDATTITASEPELKTFTKTCEGASWPQGCAHYRSAVEQQKARTIFTCSDDNVRTDADATKEWTKQHTNKKWQEYTTSAGLVCDSDEWPPGYFWDRGKTTGQIVRWIPSGDNRGVASLWNGFCKANDGGKDNGQLDKDGLVNKDLVKLGASKVDKKNNKETTSYSATFTRAVFELVFDNNVAGEKDDYALSENPCWPKYIVPNDPGYCLLTDDPWYDSAVANANNADAMAYQYNDEPEQDVIDAADKARKDAGGSSKRRRRRQLQIIDDGALAVREANNTRRLSEEEIARQVEVVQCKDRICAKERLGLRDGDGALVVEGVRMLEPRKAEAVVSDRAPAATQEARLERRVPIVPLIPVATEVAG